MLSGDSLCIFIIYVYIRTYHVSILAQQFKCSVIYSICVAGLVASGAVVFLAAGMSYYYMGGGE